MFLSDLYPLSEPEEKKLLFLIINLRKEALTVGIPASILSTNVLTIDAGIYIYGNKGAIQN